MTQSSTTPYNSSYKDAKPFSNTTAQFGLNAGTALSYTVPGNPNQKYRVDFSWAYNANVWVGYNVTATTPSLNSVTSNSNIELRPERMYVIGGDVLSFISIAQVTDAGLSLLQLPN